MIKTLHLILFVPCSLKFVRILNLIRSHLMVATFLELKALLLLKELQEGKTLLSMTQAGSSTNVGPKKDKI